MNKRELIGRLLTDGKPVRYVEPMTLEECGAVLDVTRERVRQIEAGALRKLRNRLRRAGFELEDFLDD